MATTLSIFVDFDKVLSSQFIGKESNFWTFSETLEQYIEYRNSRKSCSCFSCHLKSEALVFYLRRSIFHASSFVYKSNSGLLPPTDIPIVYWYLICFHFHIHIDTAKVKLDWAKISCFGLYMIICCVFNVYKVNCFINHLFENIINFSRF